MRRKQSAPSHSELRSRSSSWTDWIALESETRYSHVVVNIECRTCFALFGLLSLITLTFDADSLVSPSIVTLPLPHDDPLWSISTLEEWQEAFSAVELPPLYSTVWKSMLGGNTFPEVKGRYIFGGLAILYGILTEIQLYSRRAQTLYEHHQTKPSPEWSTQMHAALDRCHHFLCSKLPKDKLNLTNSERRMLFTCNTQLRSGTFRIYTQLGMPHIRFGPAIMAALATYDESFIDNEIQKFNSTHLSRSPNRAAAARLAVDRFKLPLSIGYSMLVTFGVWNFSVDHLASSIELSISI